MTAAPAQESASLTPPPPSVSPTVPTVSSIRLAPGEVIGGLPIELWLVIALFGLSGGALLVQTIRALPAAFDLIEFLPRLGFAILLLLIAVGALGVGLLAVAWRLHEADRVGRGLAYVTVAMVATSVVFSDDPSTAAVVALIAGVGAAAILALSPNVRAFFTGDDVVEPTSIVVARVCVIVLAVLLGIVSLAFLLLGADSGRYAIVGIGLIAVALGGFFVSQRLPNADRQARLMLSVGAGAAAVLLLFGLHNSGSVMLIGLVCAVPASLWLPPDARAFFGDSPLKVTSG